MAAHLGEFPAGEAGDMALAKSAFDFEGEHHVAREVEHEQVDAVSAGAGVVRHRHVSVFDTDDLDDGLGDVTRHAGEGSGSLRLGQCLERSRPCEGESAVELIAFIEACGHGRMVDGNRQRRAEGGPGHGAYAPTGSGG